MKHDFQPRWGEKSAPPTCTWIKGSKCSWAAASHPGILLLRNSDFCLVSLMRSHSDTLQIFTACRLPNHVMSWWSSVTKLQKHWERCSSRGFEIRAESIFTRVKTRHCCNGSKCWKFTVREFRTLVRGEACGMWQSLGGRAGSAERVETLWFGTLANEARLSEMRYRVSW